MRGYGRESKRNEGSIQRRESRILTKGKTRVESEGGKIQDREKKAGG